MTPNRGSTKYPEQLRKFVDRIENHAEANGHSAKEARLYGAWSACYVRYCTMQNLDWRDSDHALPFLKYLKEKQNVASGSLRRAAEGLLYVYEQMMNRNLGDVAWRPPPRRSSETAPRRRSDRNSKPSSQTSSQTSSQPSSKNGTTAASEPASASGASGTGTRASRNGSASPSSEPSADAHDDAGAASSPDESSQSSLLTRLLFHTSLPIHEAMDLRAGDVDFDAGMIYVSDAMGTPKRIVEIPDALFDPLQSHVREARDSYPGQPLDAPLFQANALKGRTADASDTSSQGDAASSSDTADETDLAEADADSRPSLWHYAGS